MDTTNFLTNDSDDDKKNFSEVLLQISVLGTILCNSRLVKVMKVGLRDLGVPYLPLDSRFAGSNPAEVDGFFQDVKILSTSPPSGTLSWGPSLGFQARQRTSNLKK